jgi:hypothetical protein
MLASIVIAATVVSLRRGEKRHESGDKASRP